MKVLITGGGTGGHLFPALAVAEALKAKVPAESILFVGAKRGMEAEEVPAAGFPFVGLDSVGFPRKVGPGSLRAAWALGRAILRARRVVRDFSPDVVFSTGGYASAPVVVGSWLERVPVVLHEQNSVPGRTNRLAARVASEVHLAFPSARAYFSRRGRLKLSGNPLRDQVLTGSRARALRQFRLEEDRFTVLVVGGSQGAHAVNQAIVDALAILDGREDLQFLLQSGQKDHEWMVERCRTLKVKTWVRRFIPNMGDAYELSDLVIGRAGAMTISEITACGLPSILIPYPYATGKHQHLNAELLVEAGAAIVIGEDELTGALLAERIDGLVKDERTLRHMASNAHLLARPQATAKITTALLRYLPGVEVVTLDAELRRSVPPRGQSGPGGPGGPGGHGGHGGEDGPNRFGPEGGRRGGGPGNVGRGDRRGPREGFVPSGPNENNRPSGGRGSHRGGGSRGREHSPSAPDRGRVQERGSAIVPSGGPA